MSIGCLGQMMGKALNSLMPRSFLGRAEERDGFVEVTMVIGTCLGDLDGTGQTVSEIELYFLVFKLPGMQLAYIFRRTFNRQTMRHFRFL